MFVLGSLLEVSWSVLSDLSYHRLLLSVLYINPSANVCLKNVIILCIHVLSLSYSGLLVSTCQVIGYKDPSDEISRGPQR